MKKLFTILSAVMITFSVAAQEFGVQAGMNMANISGEDLEETDMKIGINGGVTAALSLTDVMTLKTGVLYSTKGMQVEDDIKQSFNLSYIEIPLNIAYSVSDQISLMAGPYIGLLMSANSKLSGEFLGQTIDEEVDIKDDIANMDFGINIGASFSINESISVGAGYQLGLADIGSEGDADATHSNIHIGISYLFGDL
jgi:hypothetical protein